MRTLILAIVLLVVPQLAVAQFASSDVSAKPAKATGSTVARPVADHLADVRSVLGYIPKAYHAGIRAGTSTVDVAAYVQAAATANAGGTVYFPSGVYVLAAPVTITGATHLVGAGRSVTTFVKRGTNCATLIVDATGGGFGGVRDIGFDIEGGAGAGALLVGGETITVQGSSVTLANIRIKRTWTGIRIDAPGSTEVRGIEVRGYRHYGVWVTYTMATVVSEFLIVDRDDVAGVDLTTGIGIYIQGTLGKTVEDVKLSMGDVILGQNALYVTGYRSPPYNIPVRGSGAPAFIVSSNVFYDSQVGDVVVLDLGLDIDIDQAWIATGGGNGVNVSPVFWDVRIRGSTITNNAGHGILVRSDPGAVPGALSARHVKIQGNSISDNGRGLAGKDGIRLEDTTSDFSVQGNTITNGLYPGMAVAPGQQYGINLEAGTSDRYIIADNLQGGTGVGNDIAFVNDGGTGVNKRVANNY